MLRLTTDKKIDIMAAKNAPSARCKSGDTVLFETLDCYDCSVTRQGERLKIDRMHNPATGPLFVEGVEAGDALKVEIIKITTRDWGAMGTSFGEFGFKNVQGSDHSMHVYDIKDGVVRAGGFDIPVDNMIGVIGVAPAGEGVLTVTPRRARREHGLPPHTRGRDDILPRCGGGRAAFNGRSSRADGRRRGFRLRP